MTSVQKIFKIKQPVNYSLRTPDRQSPEQVEDYAIKKNVNTQEGTIEKVPVNDNDIANKAYVDSKVGTSADNNTTYNAQAPITLVGTTFGITQASSTVNGYLASTDFKTFSQNSDSDTTYNASAPITLVGTTFSLAQANTDTDGYLSSEDWNTFNNKADSDSDTTYSAVSPITLTATTFGLDESAMVMYASVNTLISSVDILQSDMLTKLSSATFASHSEDSTIHFTQAAISISASQVSDFDTEVSNNTDVVALLASAHTNANDAHVLASTHAQNTDTILGVGAVAQDHGAAATDMIINVCYGTSDTPPTASDTTEGTLYIQYTV